MSFEITVHETTGASAESDLRGAKRAAEATHAYSQVLAEQEPTGWTRAEHLQADGGIAAALAAIDGLPGGEKAVYRVSIHGGDDHVNVHTQRLA